MSLKLSSSDLPSPNYYSTGDGTNPVSVTVTLDNSGGTEDTNVVTTYLIATDYNYTGITVQPVNEDTGVDWVVSTDNTNWNDSTSVADMDATSSDQSTVLYFKAIVSNDSSVSTGTYTSTDIQITATENPS